MTDAIRFSAQMKPRRPRGERPICEAIVPAAYYKRAYVARDSMRYEFGAWSSSEDVGHMDGGYCLDRAEPPTGGHASRDYVHP